MFWILTGGGVGGGLIWVISNYQLGEHHGSVTYGIVNTLIRNLTVIAGILSHEQLDS